MKRFVSFNIKYYKKTKVDVLSAHCERKIEDTENVIDKKLTIKNQYFFYGKSIKQNFNEKFENYKKILGKNPRSDFNCYLEGVLAFSNDKFQKAFKEDPLVFETALTESLDRISKEFGFTGLGWSLHVDEGYKQEDGSIILNPHAHLSFFNYDFENRISTFKKLKKKDFSRMQDICGEVFKELGFERGISKKITNKKHLEKADFVAQKTKENIKLFKELNNRNKSLKTKQSKLLELEYDLISDPKPRPKFLKRLKVQIFALFSKKQKEEFKQWEAYQVKILEQRLLKEEVQNEKQNIKIYSTTMSNERKSKSRNKPSINY
jgi:hypothetical protein